MTAPQPAASPSPAIRLLPLALVNRIAAGEVVERPAAVVRELVENALDAGATRIAVALAGGGIDRIEVVDDGHGMSADGLALCVQRHCTSKLADGDLVRIATLGFRGEALPSIGAAARLTLVSRQAGSPHAHRITVAGGMVGAVCPAPGAAGTRAVVEDLFYATPARRKFLRSPRAEADHACLAATRLALAAPGVAFRLAVDDRVTFDLPAQDRAARVAALLGRDVTGMLDVAAARDAMALAGFAGTPSVSRATASGQSLVVNGRPVADPVLRLAVRLAYRDVIANGRHAVVALWLELPPEQLDVNVHPAKTELRFRDAGEVRGFVISALRQALAGGAGLAAPRPSVRPSLQLVSRGAWPRPAGMAEAQLGFDAAPSARAFGPHGDIAAGGQGGAGAAEMASDAARFPLGVAVAQVLDTYIVAATADGALVLVDQHAAHERLTHEALRDQALAGGVRSQALLLPAVVDLRAVQAGRLVAAAGALSRLGLQLEAFGPGAVLVRALPAALGAADPQPLVRDIADELGAEELGAEELGAEEPGAEELGADAPGGDALRTGGSVALAQRLDAVLARMACHGSIRAGRRLNQAEMDALLRQMEATPRAATCSHGRPTFLRLSRGEIERLFGRR